MFHSSDPLIPRSNTPRMMKLFASRGMQGVNVQLFDERLGHIINEAGGLG